MNNPTLPAEPVNPTWTEVTVYLAKLINHFGVRSLKSLELRMVLNHCQERALRRTKPCQHDWRVEDGSYGLIDYCTHCREGRA